MLLNLPRNRKLIKTSLGTSSFYYESKEKNKLIILVPGFGSSLDSFKDYFNYFSRFDVVSLDFYGRGWSDGVQNYNIDVFTEQLHDILESISYLKYKEINIIGCSMGCIITDSYLKKYKTKVNKIVFIAPAGLKLNNKPFYYNIFKNKYINKGLFTVFSPLILYIHNQKCYNLENINYSFFYFMLNHNGYVPCLLDTFINIDLDNYKYNSYKNLLIIVSSSDRVTKFDRNKFVLNPVIEFDQFGHSELIFPTKRIINNFFLNKQYLIK